MDSSTHVQLCCQSSKFSQVPVYDMLSINYNPTPQLTCWAINLLSQHLTGKLSVTLYLYGITSIPSSKLYLLPQYLIEELSIINWHMSLYYVSNTTVIALVPMYRGILLLLHVHI